MADLCEYMASVWKGQGSQMCDRCGVEIYYDAAAGYWLHAGHKDVDGANGLFCEAGMWDGTVDRVYAKPAV